MKELIKSILREETILIEGKKLSTDDFIKRAKEIHGDKYNYNKTNFINWKSNVIITCSKHGDFTQRPDGHLSGRGCKQCGREQLIVPIDKFILRSNITHDSKYGYNKTTYKKLSDKIIITCPIHGDFNQTAEEHLRGSGCPKCNRGGRPTKGNEEFIKQAKLVHGDKYSYDKSLYDGPFNKIIITCPTHGDFLQTPNHHLQGRGCQKCGNVHKRTEDEFIQEAKEVHGDKYDYSQINYVSNNKDIKIICPKHGEFYQRPQHHLDGRGCYHCGLDDQKNKVTKTEDLFIQDARKVHGNKYDYSQIKYKNNKIPIEIICSKHGSFPQAPNAHLRGMGCPTCSESKGEKLLSSILDKNNIEYERQKKFNDCVRISKISKRCSKLKFDLYLPTFNAMLEYDGIQHFESVNFFGGEKSLQDNIERDTIKNEYCEKNNIKMIRVPYTMNVKDIEPYIKKELGITS